MATIERESLLPDWQGRYNPLTFITLNLVNGTNVRTVSELVGHSNPAFTLQKYARPTTALKEAAIDKLTDKWTEARALPESAILVQKMVGGTGFEPVTPTVSLQ